MKATPGPWIVRDMPTAQRYIGPAGDGGAPSVALVLARVNVPDERLEADARLIAAAPDLLAALQVMLGTAGEELTPEQRLPIMQKARGAIAKATGAAQ